jgi:hypothetical protein
MATSSSLHVERSRESPEGLRRLAQAFLLIVVALYRPMRDLLPKSRLSYLDQASKLWCDVDRKAGRS